MPRILIEIHEGQIVRNFLANGLLDHLTRQGVEVLLVTPAALVSSFRAQYICPGVTIEDWQLLAQRSPTRIENYEFAVSQALGRRGYNRGQRILWRRIGEPLARRQAVHEKQRLAAWQPDVVVSTHLSQLYGRNLVAAARGLGIPTVGNLLSWDNIWKGLRIRPDVITCWSEHTKQEICRLAGYRPEQVQVIGAPAFDAYFAPDAAWSRSQLCTAFNLDPDRPVLMFATLGQFKQQIDETNALEVLLRAIDAGEIPGRPQVVLRLHPWSKQAYFAPFMDRPDVRASGYKHYVPGLTWTPTREETIRAGNLLRHADVIISPGSTMCIESAIFDTPTVIPVFNEYMPEVFDAYFERTWLRKHFSRLYKNDWVPVLRSGEEMIAGINRALADPTWYQEGRERIRQEFLGPLDGRATERFAQTILDTC
jgi:hypothetical protein